VTGTLYGVGVGPGDPELLTFKAARIINQVDVVAFHSAPHGKSIARSIAQAHLRPGQVEEALVYPVTRGSVEHPDGYRGAIEEFYAAAADRLAVHLAVGRDVALLAEGDPTLYSSFMHMHRRLRERFCCVLVPGITSVSAAAAAAGLPLVEGDEVLSVIPATLPEDDLRRWLTNSDAAAIMKVSRNLAGLRSALSAAGRIEQATYIRRASQADERVLPFADLTEDELPYMATVLVPGPRASRVTTPGRQAFRAPASARPTPPAAGRVVVVGLGPAGPQWCTPQATVALRAAQHVVGYKTYLDRVPVIAGQQRHASDNRVEAERAEFALELARRGGSVAVVSSGDPGVFGMAAAVLEVQADAHYEDVQVDILPGVTAASAVASRVGAPLGHDYCVISLSDQLKPWPMIMKRLAAAAESDLVVACYNPASRARRDHLLEVRDLFLRYREPDTPLVLGRAVGTAEESADIVMLKELHPDLGDMRTLVIIGSSATRTSHTISGVSVFTPRRYT
jgi:precorrin-2 C20-methyltransferase/precorrin-3B C17-methyltransferase